MEFGIKKTNMKKNPEVSGLHSTDELYRIIQSALRDLLLKAPSLFTHTEEYSLRMAESWVETALKHYEKERE